MALNQDMKALVPRRGLTSEYLALVLSGLSTQILAATHKLGATVDSIEMEQFLKLGTPVPPLPEQESVVARVTTQTSQLDSLTTAIHISIDTLREYRTALISAAVTGKIDVRQEVA